MSKLTKEQKESVALLSVGTFLEYFDLMLYVHMATLLNELFFPQTDAKSTQLLATFTFCSTFVFRPIGALIFGYIGDNLGRKITIIITTMMMATSCLIIMTLPTYAQIGIVASWMMILCRVLQGMSSLGEIIGAEIYLTETIREKPLRYTSASYLCVAVSLGSFAALGIASLIIKFNFNWRYAFAFGLVIAIIGSVARSRLQEAADFINSKNIVRAFLKSNNKNTEEEIQRIINHHELNKEISSTRILAFFFTQCSWPTAFYIIYIYCGGVLKECFNYTAEQVIHNNLIVSIFQVLSLLIITFIISRKVHPLTIAKLLLIPFVMLVLATPYILEHANTSFSVLALQCALALCMMGGVPCKTVCNAYFPIFKRFTYVAVIFALAYVVINIFFSFSFIFLIDYLGYYAIYVLLLIAMCFFWGVCYFRKLEKENKEINYNINDIIFNNQVKL